MDKVLHTESGHINISPYMFQIYAKDFFASYINVANEGKYSPSKYYLICHSIELAAKALIISVDMNHMEIKNISHNILKVCKHKNIECYSIYLSDEEIVELGKANEYYSRKGFEYFWFKGPDEDPRSIGLNALISGWPKLPDLLVLENILKKLLSIDLEKMA
jgi:hypothetical protein